MDSIGYKPTRKSLKIVSVNITHKLKGKVDGDINVIVDDDDTVIDSMELHDVDKVVPSNDRDFDKSFEQLADDIE